MKILTTNLSNINQKITLLMQIKSVLKRQFQLLRTLKHTSTNVSIEIQKNASAYLDKFNNFDIAYFKFSQEFANHYQARQNNLLRQTNDHYLSLQQFKDELMNECVANNIAIETDARERDKESDATFRNNNHSSFWAKLLNCGFTTEKAEQLIEIPSTDSKSNLNR